jgi:ABC-2 type transport system permease protein
MNRKLVESLTQAIYIAKKDAKLYYFKQPVIMFGIIFPTFLYFSFSIGREIPPNLFLPALVAVTSLFASGSIVVVSLSMERGAGTLDRLLTAPVSLSMIVLGKALAGCAFGFVLSMIFTGVFMPLSGFPLKEPFLFVTGVALSSFAFAALGMPISVYANTPPEAMMPLNLVRFPMMFLCGVFIPFEALPVSLQAIARLLPLTYSVELLRQAATGSVILQTLLLDIAALTLFLLALLLLATKMLRKSIQ